MTPEQAERILGRLVGVTNGWTDEAVNLYAEEFESLEDPVALSVAVDRLLKTATSTYRPPPGEIRAIYNAEALRRASVASGELPPAEDHYPTFEEGIAIARDAYHAERYRMGLPSSDTHFERWLGLSKEARKEAAEEREAHSGARGEFRRRR